MNYGVSVPPYLKTWWPVRFVSHLDYSNNVLFGTTHENISNYRKHIAKLHGSWLFFSAHFLYSSPTAATEYRVNFKLSALSVPLTALICTQSCVLIIIVILSNINLLSVPFVRSSFSVSRFSTAAPKTWNSLSPALRICTCPDTFRRHLKAHYF